MGGFYFGSTGVVLLRSRRLLRAPFESHLQTVSCEDELPGRVEKVRKRNRRSCVTSYIVH